MIELQGISKIFNPGKANEIVALSTVSLRIERGEFVTLIGSNGSGKTTLLNLIAGTESPSTGVIRISGQNVTRLPEYRRSQWIARVFQNPMGGTAPDLSILSNFRLAALRTQPKMLTIGITEAFKKEVRDRVALLQMGLENKLNQPMGALSGGQRQALTLLMCVMDRTDILLLDEPTAALDPRSADIVMQTAKQLIEMHQLTTVLITHNLKDALQYGNRLIQMENGDIRRDLCAADKAQLTLKDLYAWFE